MAALRLSAAACWRLLAVVGILIADIASKQWATAILKNDAPIVWLPLLQLVYVENTGIAFGIFAGSGGRWLLVVLALLLSAALLYHMRQTADQCEKWACALIVAGALGNVIDRWRFGYVVDFIDVHWGGYHWPAFNVADTAISSGALLFAYRLLLRRQNI